MNDPKLYQECNIIQKRDAFSSLEKYAPALKWKSESNSIIDLGCGDGSVTNILKTFLPSNYKLLACDINENMVNFASEHHSNAQTTFRVLDIAGQLPEDMKGGFDHVFSFYALNWVTDQKRAFENIYSLLDDNGECFLTLAAYHTIHDVYRILSRRSKWSTWITDAEKYISPYHDSETPDTDILKLIKNTGFVDCWVECKDMTFIYDNDVDMRKHSIAVSPFKIPEDMQDDFVADYKKILRDMELIRNGNCKNSQEKLTLRYNLIIVYGRKPSVTDMSYIR